jgi:hypothetical protein
MLNEGSQGTFQETISVENSAALNENVLSP